MLSDVYENLCRVLQDHATGRIQSRTGSDGGFTLYYPGPLTAMGREMPELYFVGTTPRKSSVVFYYFPLYMNEELAAKLDPGLMKLLKGKTCFHLKTWTPEIEKAIREAVTLGSECFDKIAVPV